MKKLVLGIMCVFMVLMAFSISARADTGPKPHINIKINNFETETCYATLYAEKGGPSPVSFGDWNDIPEDIKKAFSEYSDSEECRFVEDVWMIDSSDNVLNCGYMPPSSFKLVVYLPETDIFLESDIYERYAFESDYEVDIQQQDENGKLILKKASYDYLGKTLSVLLRLILTLLIEISIAVAFGIKGKKSLLVLIATNVITQIYLNARMGIFEYKSGFGLGFSLLYIVLEIEIIIIEAIVYSIALKRTNEKTITSGKAAMYSLLANSASLFAGVILAMLGL